MISRSAAFGRMRSWLLGSLVAGMACASGSGGMARDLVVYPPAPDTARIQFLTRITTSSDVGQRGSMYQTLVGERPNEVAITTPYGVGVAPGRQFVCDSPVQGVIVIDLDGKDLEFIQPRGIAALRTPVNCHVGPDSLLYVTDTSRRQVMVFTLDGDYVDAFGDDPDARPVDVFVDTETIWVADVGLRKVRVYDRASRRFIREFPGAEPDSAAVLVGPANLYVTDDEVLVSDLLASRVTVYDHAGNYRRTIGGSGTGFGNFSRPKGVAVDHDGLTYVVDAAFENVQVFNGDGELLMFFGGPYARPGDMVSPAKVVLDYDNLEHYRPYVHPDFELKYLILVTNRFGPDKVNVYGFVGPPGL